MNIFIQDKLDEFENLFVNVFYEHSEFKPSAKKRPEAVRNFLKSALLEQQEQIVNIIQGNYKGSFTDDGGNDCWYVDDLVSIIKDLKN